MAFSRVCGHGYSHACPRRGTVRYVCRSGVLVASPKGSAGDGGAVRAGLMLDGRRKSMQPLAQRLRGDHQRLQRFVTPRRGMWCRRSKTPSRRACDLIAPDAWVVDDTGFTKDDDRSPGVARQYSGTLGKVDTFHGDTGIAVSVHAASDAASAPLDWRLFLPESWDDRGRRPTPMRSRRSPPAGSGPPSPFAEHHRPKWEMTFRLPSKPIRTCLSSPSPTPGSPYTR